MLRSMRDLWRRADLRRRLEGYTLSILLHAILLLVLATITITATGEGFGFGARSKGPTVRMEVREETVDDAELEDLIEDLEVKPVEVERTRRKPVELPQLASISVPRPRPDRLEHLDTRYSSTAGVGSLSGRFGLFIGGLRKTGLDVALVIDATASMQNVIDDIKKEASTLVERIQTLVPIARVGVVAFRDRGEAFVVRWTDLSFHGNKVRAFIENLKAEGGGDWEEGVRQGLEAAIDELSWRKRAKRVIILVGSSPPHKEDMAAILALAEEFREAGGVISTIDLTERMHEEYERKMHKWLFGTEPRKISPLPAFYDEVREAYRRIANAGGGETVALGSGEDLTEQILYFAFGSKWRKEVARYAK